MEKQANRTTMAALKMMGVVNEDGSTKAAPGPTENVTPFGQPKGLLDLSAVGDKRQEWMEVRNRNLDELKARVAAAPGKIAAAKEAGASQKAVLAAELQLAAMQDQLHGALRAEVHWYLLDVLYLILQDFQREDFRSALGEMPIGTITVDLPSIMTATATLVGPGEINF